MRQPASPDAPGSQPELESTAAQSEQPRYEFHRLMRRGHNYRWWRPLALLGTSLGFFLILSFVLVVASLLAMIFSPPAWLDDFTEQSATLDFDIALNMADPAIFIVTMLSIIIILPACYLAYLFLGSKPAGLLISVTGKIRWKWLGLITIASTVIYALYFGLNFLLEALGVLDPTTVPEASLPQSPWVLAILVLLLVPFQAAAEEVLFRGVFMQVIGSWLKHPLFAILLPIPLFVVGHLYDVWGLLDVGFFALAAGYLTWRTGGLEAAMAVHVVNNVALFLLGAAGLLDMNSEQSNLGALLASVVLTGILTLVIVRLATKYDIKRSAGPAAAPARPQLLQPWPAPHPAYPPAPSASYYPPANASGAYWAPPQQYDYPSPSVQQPHPGPAPQDPPPETGPRA